MEQLSVIEGGKSDLAHNPDELTVLVCHSSKSLAKKVDISKEFMWKVTPYDKVKKYAVESIECKNLHEMYSALRGLSEIAHKCVVLGSPVDGEWEDGKIITQRKSKGLNPTLESRPVSWLPMDIDNIHLPKETSKLSAEEIDSMIHTALNLDVLSETDRIIFLTSSHGAPNSCTAKIRLWYRLEEPQTIETLKRWVNQLNLRVQRQDSKTAFDVSIYQPQQPIYTARPKFEKNGDISSDPFDKERFCIIDHGHKKSIPSSQFKHVKSEAVQDKAFVEKETDEEFNGKVLVGVRESGLLNRKIADGKYAITCPWEENHSAKADKETDSSTIIFVDPNTRQLAFKCLHDSCCDKRTTTFLFYLAEKDFLEQTVLESSNDNLIPKIRRHQKITTEISLSFPEIAYMPENEKLPYYLPDSKYNLAYFCKLLGVTIRKNVLTGDLEMIRCGEIFRKSESSKPYTIFLEEMRSLLRTFSKTNPGQGLTFSETQLNDCICVNLDTKLYNPVTEYMEAILPEEYDSGHDYIKDVMGCLEVEHPKITYTLFRKMFIAAVAAADANTRTPLKRQNISLNKYENVLVLVGDQGLKKSEFLRRLIPPSLIEYFADNESIDMGDKDSHIKMSSKWIVELGEFGGTVSRNDTNSMKQYLSKTEDEFRRPYAREAEKKTRRTVFFASVNEHIFLSDVTGNRRIWPVTLHSIDRVKIRELNLAGLWKQAYDLYMKGEEWWLSEEDEVTMKSIQSEHTMQDTLELYIEQKFDIFNECNEEDQRIYPLLNLFEYVMDRPPKAGWEIAKATSIIQSLQRRGRNIKLQNENGEKFVVTPPPREETGDANEFKKYEKPKTELVLAALHIPKVEIVDADMRQVEFLDIADELLPHSPSTEELKLLSAALHELQNQGYAVSMLDLDTWSMHKSTNLKCIRNQDDIDRELARLGF